MCVSKDDVQSAPAASKCSSDILHVYNNIYIAFGDIEQVKLTSRSDESIMLIPFIPIQRPHDSGSAPEDKHLFQPSYLTAIWNFDEKVKGATKHHYGQKLVFCSTVPDMQSCARIAFLLGCHMIMTHGIGFEETYLAIRCILQRIAESSSLELAVETSLRAFCSARCLSWIDFSQNKLNKGAEHQSIDMEEFVHYAR